MNSIRLVSILSLLATGSICANLEEFIDPLIDQFARSFGQSVPVPATDVTRPLVTLSVPDFVGGGPNLVLDPTSLPLNVEVKPSSISFYVTAVAEDPEGVKSAAVQGKAVLRCSNDDGIGQLREAVIIVASTDDAVIGENSFTRRWILFRVHSDFIHCAERDTFRPIAIEFQLFGRGENFGRQVIDTAMAIFTYQF